MQINPKYLAGFFDGEGCVCLGTTTASGTNKVYPSLTVSLAQSGENGKELLENIQVSYGGHLTKNKRIKDSHKDGFHLRWRGKKAIVFLKIISPFLIIKKQKAQEVCIFMEDYYARRAI